MTSPLIAARVSQSLPANNGAWQVQHMKDSAESGDEHFPNLEMDRDLSENTAKPLQLGSGWGRRWQRWCTLYGPPFCANPRLWVKSNFLHFQVSHLQMQLKWMNEEANILWRTQKPFFSFPSLSHSALLIDSKDKTLSVWSTSEKLDDYYIFHKGF